TELDVMTGSNQANIFGAVTRACLAVTRCTGITVWGVRDCDSWRGSDNALLFDCNGNKKSAYDAVLNALNSGTPIPTTPPPNPTTPPPNPTTPPPNPTTPPPGPSGCSASVTVNSWTGGFVVNVKVTAGSSGTRGWNVALMLPAGASVTNTWSATASGSSGSVRFANVDYNGQLAAGQVTEFGFQGTGTASGLAPTCTAS
ncbi:cellulose binding domain-containing protein, partial [Micromonospora profundi]